MNINSTATLQQPQMRNMNSANSGHSDSYGNQKNNNNFGKMMRETLKMLPQETQIDIRSLIQALDPSAKQNTISQITQLDASNMTTQELTSAIMNLLQQSTQNKPQSSYSSFSIYV